MVKTCIALSPEISNILDEYARIEGQELDVEKLILEGICLEYLGVLSTNR
jgi:hypothetical protein